MIYEFKLPDIGEGLVEGEITKWHVKEGDTVKENQPIANVLTDKAEVEIPSPKNGKVLKLMAKEGEKIKVHATFITFEVEGGSSAAKAPAGGGPGNNGTSKPAAPQPAPKAASAAPAPATPKAPQTPSGFQNKNVIATPLVRKLAQQAGIDLANVKGSGPAGRILESDLPGRSEGNAAPRSQSVAQPPAKPAAAALAEGDQAVPFIGIRRKTAERMAQSAHTVAAVTHMDECDFTTLVALREELKPQAAKKGVKLTYLPFIIKALTKSLREFPGFNAQLDEQGGNIIRKAAHNVGIAVSAEQGLVVPNIKSADSKDVWALAKDVNELAEKVRAKKIDVPSLQGGTFTITNIGPIGGLFATPIVNVPEVAILGILKLQKRPVVKDGAVVVRDMCNLVLSFDHRVNDGAEAAQFMNTIIKHLENPRTLL